MPDIKTKDAIKGTIKTIDKSAVTADRMRSAYVQTKERAEHTTSPAENSAEEYASDRVEGGIDRITHEAAYQFDKQGKKSVQTTKQNISKAKDGIRNFKEKRTVQSMERQAQSVRTAQASGQNSIKVAEQAEKTVKQSARSAGKKTIKTVEKTATKAATKTVKTAERTAKTSIKTAQQTAKAAQKTAQATAKTAQKAAQAAKAVGKVVVTGIKAAVKATIATVKAIIAATKALVSAIVAGGWIAVVIILVICLVALLIGSVYGIFFSGEDSGTGQTMQTVVQEINTDYEAKLQAEKDKVSYDKLEMSGSRAVWKDVLAVYAVKVNTDPDNPQEIATMDDNKKQLLKDIFWQMNSISSRTETKTETEIIETDDGHGNILQTEKKVTRTYLYITVSHKTPDEMADKYGFNKEQRTYLKDLLKDENNSLWSQVLYGVANVDDSIVQVALTQASRSYTGWQCGRSALLVLVWL